MHVIIHYLQLLDEIMSSDGLWKQQLFRLALFYPLQRREKWDLSRLSYPRWQKLIEWETWDPLPGLSDSETFSYLNSPSCILQPQSLIRGVSGRRGATESSRHSFQWSTTFLFSHCFFPLLIWISFSKGPRRKTEHCWHLHLIKWPTDWHGGRAGDNVYSVTVSILPEPEVFTQPGAWGSANPPPLDPRTAGISLTQTKIR